MTSRPTDPDGQDPLLARRLQISRAVTAGKRVGYGLFALAIIGFFAGLVFGFEPWLANTIVVALLVGSAVLAPAIVFGYGVRAAAREERTSEAE